MIIFSLDGILFYSMDQESGDIEKILDKWKEDTLSEEPWVDEEDWKTEYYSVESFLEWYHQFHRPFKGHLAKFDFPDFNFVEILDSEVPSSEVKSA